MRIVAIADTHLYHQDLRSLPAGDVLVHAGDLLKGGSLEELASVVPWLSTLDFAHKVVVAGNHDWCFQRDRAAAETLLGSGVMYLEDSETTVHGVRFWGSPWQPVFRNWAFNLPRGAPLAARWALIPEGIDVLITHGPPRGIGDWQGEDGREGCADLRTAVERVRPRIHLFGHIHQDGGSQCSLGVCCMTGDGAPCRPHLAALWYGRAAQQGNWWAMYLYGLCFRDGTGLRHDCGQARHWLQKATRGGIQEAAEACAWLRVAERGGTMPAVLHTDCPRKYFDR